MADIAFTDLISKKKNPIIMIMEDLHPPNIFQSNLFKRPPPKQILIQSLLNKTTTCLTRPATSFFVSQMKKNLPKTTTTKFYPAKKWERNIRQQCLKNKRLSDYTLFLLYNAKFV